MAFEIPEDLQDDLINLSKECPGNINKLGDLFSLSEPCQKKFANILYKILKYNTPLFRLKGTSTQQIKDIKKIIATLSSVIIYLEMATTASRQIWTFNVPVTLYGTQTSNSTILQGYTIDEIDIVGVYPTYMSEGATPSYPTKVYLDVNADEKPIVVLEVSNAPGAGKTIEYIVYLVKYPPEE